MFSFRTSHLQDDVESGASPMEALGVAASVAGVLSLAIQLGDRIHVLLDFWDSVKEAPADVARIRFDLDIIGRLMFNIASSRHRGQPIVDVHLLEDCLQSCNASVGSLEAIVADLEMGLSGNGVRRCWTRLRKPMREAKIARLFQELERAKSTVMLFQIVENSSGQVHVFKNLDALSQSLNAPPAYEASRNEQSMPNALMKYKSHDIDRSIHVLLNSSYYYIDLIMGTISVLSRSSLTIHERTAEGRTTRKGGRINRKLAVTFRPRPMLVPWSFEFHCARAFGQWTRTIRTFNLVDTAPVFTYCLAGDIKKVQQCLDDGLATPFDVDREGWTLLHYAARECNADLCRMLIRLGAVVHCTTKLCDTPLMLAMHRSGDDPKRAAASIESVRVLVQEGQADPMDLDDKGRTALEGFNASVDCINWLLKQDTFEIDFNHRELYKHLDTLLHLNNDDSLSPTNLLNLIEQGIDLDAEIRATPPYGAWRNAQSFQGLTLLHHAVMKWSDPAAEPDNGERKLAVKVLLQAGAKPNIQAKTGETAVDCILQAIMKPDLYTRTIEEFDEFISTWLELLEEAGVDIEQYILEEARIHMDRTFDYGFHAVSVMRFNATAKEKVHKIWNEFSGPEERERGVWVKNFADLDHFSAWEEHWCIPSRRRRYEERRLAQESMVSTVVKEIKKIIPLPLSPSSLEKQPFSQAATNPPMKNKPPLYQMDVLPNPTPRRIGQMLLVVLAFFERFRLEFSLYIMVTTFLLGLGSLIGTSVWLAAFWGTMSITQTRRKSTLRNLEAKTSINPKC